MQSFMQSFICSLIPPLVCSWQRTHSQKVWMVIYAHPLCTNILLNVDVPCTRNFLHKKCGCFWHKPQQPAQTERQAKTTSAVSAEPAKGWACADAGLPRAPQGSPGLNLSTLSPMASRARRCSVSRWQAGRAQGKWVTQGPYTVPSYTWC